MKRILAGILLVLVLSTVMSMCISNNSSASSNPLTTSTVQQSTTTTSTTQETSTSTSQIDITKLHFYMFGAAGCPHCGRMKEEIPKQFGKDKFTYYELQGNEHNQKLFSELYSILGVSGVPLIGIFYDNHLVAVIEGEYNVKSTPEIVQVALKENGVVFISGKVYLIPSNHTEIIKKLEAIFMNGEPSEG
ncbi:MAG: glutaredoxin [Thermococcus sp.]|uniref:glutaredoxin n=1 Tax=Thermococcus sp. TaxID=35749 RepID=UPI001D9909FF|nr:glutaredoxin [Thermococcus sp.]MBO8174886.1 glutaredoxin [Thermococcus sp.]